MAKRVVFQRADKKWGWRLHANNGQVIATDGNQGYESEATCASIADRIISGEFGGADKSRQPLV